MSGDDVKEVNFRYEKCTVERVAAVEALHNIVIPLRYPAGDYARAIESNARTNLAVSWLAYDCDGDSLVGALVCRVEDRSVYILTLAVVATYREQGIGTKLLEHSIKSVLVAGGMRMYAHVQQGNDDALRLYGKKGFVEKELVENYYRRLRPPHAIVVEKCFAGTP